MELYIIVCHTYVDGTAVTTDIRVFSTEKLRDAYVEALTAEWRDMGYQNWRDNRRMFYHTDFNPRWYETFERNLTES